MFVDKNDLKDVTPLQKCNLKSEIASDRLRFFLRKTDLEFFSGGLEFF